MARIVSTDVDIDCFGRDKILEGLEYAFARIDRPNDQVEKHPTGVYFQNIPRDPVTNISTIDHRIANDYGYFKIDFLNVNMYEGIKSEQHLLALLDKEPQWELFQYAEITEKLFHLSGYSHLLLRFPPKSVEDIAMILAMIRPAKSYLQSANWEKVCNEIWDKTLDRTAYHFKRQHSISYALAIIVHLNLLIEQILAD